MLINEVVLSTLVGALGVLIAMYIVLRRVEHSLESLETSITKLTATLDALRTMN